MTVLTAKVRLSAASARCCKLSDLDGFLSVTLNFTFSVGTSISWNGRYAVGGPNKKRLGSPFSKAGKALAISLIM